MKAVLDFLINALPWVALGLMVALTGVRMKTGASAGWLKILSFLPVLCFGLVGVISMARGDQSGGTVWLVLAVCNGVMNMT